MTALLGLAAATVAQAVSVTTPTGIVTFDLPEGFKALSADEIEAKHGVSPENLIQEFVTADATVSIGVGWMKGSGVPVTQGQLPDVMRVMKDVITQQQPGAAWVGSELVSLKDHKWIRFELRRPGIETDTHYILYFTDVGGSLVNVNLIAKLQGYYLHRADLTAFAPSVEPLPGAPEAPRYSVVFGLLHDPHKSLKVDEETDVIALRADGSMPFMGANIDSSGSDPFLLSYKVYRRIRGSEEYELTETSKPFRIVPKGNSKTLIAPDFLDGVLLGDYRFDIFVNSDPTFSIRFSVVPGAI
jgi:hypothetical protein